MEIPILADLPSTPDFRAELRDDGLHLPAPLGAVLKRNNLLTAEDLVACAHSFPSLLSTELGWSLEQVQAAMQELVRLLAGRVPDEILHPQQPPPRVYGARPPGKDR